MLRTERRRHVQEVLEGEVDHSPGPTSSGPDGSQKFASACPVARRCAIQSESVTPIYPLPHVAILPRHLPVTRDHHDQEWRAAGRCAAFATVVGPDRQRCGLLGQH